MLVITTKSELPLKFAATTELMAFVSICHELIDRGASELRCMQI